MNRLNTPPSFFFKEEAKNMDPTDQPAWENMKCDIHPSLKLDAICANDSRDEIKLVCIRCIIEGKDYQSAEGDKLHLIKDVIQNCADTISSNNDKILKTKDNLQEKFMHFLTKEYVRGYEKHMETQFNLVDKEIKGLINELEELRNKYKLYYTQELNELKKKDEEVREKMNAILDESIDLEIPRLKTPQDIYDQLNTVENKDQLKDFMKSLYNRSKERVNISDNSNQKVVLSLMDEIKEKASKVEVLEADISKFKELNHSVDDLLKMDVTAIFNPEPKHTYLPPTEFSFSEHHKGFSDEDFSVALHPLDKDLHEFSPRETVNKSLHSGHNLRNLNNFTSTEKKRKRNRFVDIESHSLRTLTRSYETKEENDEELKEKAVSKLNDWINRRLTGYLIFQNTINSNPNELQDRAHHGNGKHLNSLMGDKWKSLALDEKEEYNNFAKDFRKAFRKEIEEYESYDDLTDLIEKLDQKIKKIKKE